MSIIEFPKKEKKKEKYQHKCICEFLYGVGYDQAEECYGVSIAQNFRENGTVELSCLSGFESAREAQLAAYGFIEALRFVHEGGLND